MVSELEKAENAKTLLSNVRGLPPAEWNDTTKAYQHFSGLQELFEKQAQRTPENAAVEFHTGGAEQLSYRELNERANCVAHALQRLGVGPDSLVGICAERSIEMVVGILGIIKSGAAYVPFDPNYPAERLTFMLEDTQAPIILTQQKLAGVLPQGGAKILCLDSDWKTFATESTINPPCRVQPDNLGYLIYTSGSTGRPKGVAMRQEPLINLLQWQRENWSAPAAARTLQFASINFDVSFQEIFSTWFSGGTLVLISEEDRRNSSALAEFLRTHQIERLFLPFVALKYLAEAAERWKVFPQSLKEVITAGEQLQVTPQIASFFSNLPGCTLENQYGPSETHVVTAYRLQGPPDTWPKLPSIGRPIANTQIHLLDERMQRVPVGETGELYIGGVCLARGYLNQSELTLQKFLPDPFSYDRDARLYKTGDVARYLPDGNIEFLGRTDHQVKIRGFRIELGEIEVLLSRHPSVREAVTIAGEKSSGDKQLIAYVVPKNGSINPRELREFLGQSLPPYAVPSLFVTLPRLPLSLNGKVDRRALPSPSEIESTTAEETKQARDAMEMQLQLIFEKFFERRPISIDVSFFELGGDSLQALRLVVEIERATGKRLPLNILYEGATIESLAKRLGQQNVAMEFSSLVPLQASGSRPPLFLIHTTPGDLLGYGNLVFHLDPDQPSFGFQSIGLHRVELKHTRLEEMAAHYVKLLREQQPKGPYFLGGWCYGGLVAFEMAQQLAAARQEVMPLFLIETPAPSPGLSNLYYYTRRIRCALKMSPALWQNYLREKLRYYFGFQTALNERFKRIESDDAETAERNQIIEQLENIYYSNLNALKFYKPRRYHGKIILFNAERQDPALVHDSLYGWPALVSDIEAYVVPGGHDTILMEPNVSVLAAKIQSCLHELQNQIDAPQK